MVFRLHSVSSSHNWVAGLPKFSALILPGGLSVCPSPRVVGTPKERVLVNGVLKNLIRHFDLGSLDKKSYIADPINQLISACLAL